MIWAPILTLILTLLSFETVQAFDIIVISILYLHSSRDHQPLSSKPTFDLSFSQYSLLRLMPQWRQWAARGSYPFLTLGSYLQLIRFQKIIFNFNSGGLHA